MKTIYGILIYITLVFLLVQSCYSQSCIEGLVVFRTQSEIDSFPVVYPGCIEVSGNFVIRSGNDDPIYNLDSLIQLQVMSSLILNGTEELVDLEGLNNVSSISWMSITRNEKLESLNGLDNLQTLNAFSILMNPLLSDISSLLRIEEVEGHINFRNNEQFRNFHGLENLKRVGGNFYIQFNENLEGFEGLEKLESIGGSFIIGNNPQIHNLTGLDKLGFLEKNLFIIANDKLETFSGLEKLEHIGLGHPGAIFISNNHQLRNLNGLINLKSISGVLGIWNNPQLNSINGLKNVAHSGVISTFSGYEDFILYNNPELAVCNNRLVCDIIADTSREVIIFGNKAGCDSKEVIHEQCLTVKSTEIMYEENNLGIFPNPNSGTFILHDLNQRSGEITAYNIKGEKIYSLHVHEEVEVTLSFHQNGMYVIRFIDDNTGKAFTRSVIVR